jgi:hypothetical protein
MWIKLGFALSLSLSLVMVGCSDDDNGPGPDTKVTAQDSGADLPAVDQGGVTVDGPVQPDQTLDPDVLMIQDGPLVDQTLTDGIFLSCTAQVGTATVTGSVNGNPVTASHAGGVAVGGMGLYAYGIALLDQSGTCSGLASVVAAPKLWILLCDNKPGTYSVGSSCLPDGGGGLSFNNQVTIPSPGTDPKATSGTITITSLDTACGKQVKGSFSVSFSGDQVSGSFDTVGCGEINP